MHVPTLSAPRKPKSWLRRKLLLFEVTFCLYMMTPVEKLALYSFFALSISLLAAATMLCLPQHIRTVAERACFYIFGDSNLIGEMDIPDYSRFETTTRYAAAPVAASFSLGWGDVKSYMG
ncbi:hypothetical protein ABW20_dc0107865 [Dactylellina cionopaga]|nr:hypothetical protein ABW20_dc0107865 [Dactylellina cionopaga]